MKHFGAEVWIMGCSQALGQQDVCRHGGFRFAFAFVRGIASIRALQPGKIMEGALNADGVTGVIALAQHLDAVGGYVCVGLGYAVSKAPAAVLMLPIDDELRQLFMDLRSCSAT